MNLDALQFFRLIGHSRPIVGRCVKGQLEHQAHQQRENHEYVKNPGSVR